MTCPATILLPLVGLALISACGWIAFQALRGSGSYRVPWIVTVDRAPLFFRLFPWAIPLLCAAGCVYRAAPELWFHRVVGNGNTVVAAIRSYERDHGYPPQEFEYLVPAYLSSIPSTGCPGSDQWYFRSGPAWWELSVEIDGWLQYDSIVYAPCGIADLEGHLRIRRGEWVYMESLYD